MGPLYNHPVERVSVATVKIVVALLKKGILDDWGSTPRTPMPCCMNCRTCSSIRIPSFEERVDYETRLGLMKYQYGTTIIEAPDDEAAISVAERFLPGGLHLWQGEPLVKTLSVTSSHDSPPDAEARFQYASNG
jgi:hypothetical protein